MSEEVETKPKIKIMVRSYTTRPHHATRIFDESLGIHRIYITGVDSGIDITQIVEDLGVDLWDASEDEIFDVIQQGVDEFIKIMWEEQSLDYAIQPEQYSIRFYCQEGMEKKIKTQKVRREMAKLLNCDDEVAERMIECSLLPPEQNLAYCGSFPKEVAGMQAKYIESKFGHLFKLKLCNTDIPINDYVEQFIEYVNSTQIEE